MITYELQKQSTAPIPTRFTPRCIQQILQANNFAFVFSSLPIIRFYRDSDLVLKRLLSLHPAWFIVQLWANRCLFFSTFSRCLSKHNISMQHKPPIHPTCGAPAIIRCVQRYPKRRVNSSEEKAHEVLRFGSWCQLFRCCWHSRSSLAIRLLHVLLAACSQSFAVESCQIAWDFQVAVVCTLPAVETGAAVSRSYREDDGFKSSEILEKKPILYLPFPLLVPFYLLLRYFHI